jgi:ATP-dependent helicase/nuclease subunit A
VSGAAVSARALTLVNASAGSGKTHRLTAEVVRSLGAGGHDASDAVAVDGLVAVTYTRKAAAELSTRIRSALVGACEVTRAQQLPFAYIGTVHAVCLRLIQEHAIDAGLSPEIDVVPGDEQRLLLQALECGLSPELRRRVQNLAYVLRLRWDPARKSTDWMTPVGDIMTLARGNRISPEALPEMAERSAARLLALLGTPARDGPALDRALHAALEQADRELAALDEPSKVGRDARKLVRRALCSACDGAVSWEDWMRLAGANDKGARREILGPVKEAAARADVHPRLHDDVRELTRALYAAAAEGLRAYRDWKSHLRVVDFVDMIDRALTLVHDAEVASELRRRLELLVVDEVQDTSPVQLAFFLALHGIAGRSMWVGDPKQCIFEFAGADPGLMQSITRWVADHGGALDRLDKNYRSRPELVRFCSLLFAEAFRNQGFDPDGVVVTPHRPKLGGPSAPPPLGLWALDPPNGTNEQTAGAIAEGVRRLLAHPDDTPVVDRVTGQIRPVRPGDVALLVATNAEADRIAHQLARRGIRAAIARSGLLDTPEGTFVQAGLRRVLDARDTLAEAEIAALSSFDGASPNAWLEATIRGDALPDATCARNAALERLRSVAGALSPSEVLDQVMSALDLVALAARWPDPHQRTANLEALRALVREYEERCRHEHEPATLAGLLRYFAEARRPVFMRNERLASDHQHVSEGAHAVTLVTYHRAKGLEWPVVILTSLDRAFDVSPETDRAELDPGDPLGGRWIRYWPWPFGQQRMTALAERAAASAEGRAVAERERRERIRLLYVGFTRARDHLVLAVRRQKSGLATHWLDELADAGTGKPLLPLPLDISGVEPSLIGVRGSDGTIEQWPARCWALDPGTQPPARLGGGDRHVVFERSSAAPPERCGYRIAPSRAQDEWPELPQFVVIEQERYGDRIPLGDSKNVSWDTVGDALHAFLAADVPRLTAEARQRCAERQLDAADLHKLLAPTALVKAADDLRELIRRRWPDAEWQREVPVTAVVESADGTRRIYGMIDLLLRTQAGVVVIDYKTFPGGASGWSAKAIELAPQLAAYARALEIAGERVLETWLCFAVGGGAVRVG